MPRHRDPTTARAREDLEQVAAVALLKVIAVPTIGELKRYSRVLGWTIRAPRGDLIQVEIGERVGWSQMHFERRTTDGARPREP